MPVQLSDAAVEVNNDVVAVVPNSVVFDEGFGEQTVRAASVGGGAVQQVFSNNVETSFSTVKFDIFATVENIALARGWKAGTNTNLVQIAGRTVDGTMTRTFTQASLMNNYEVPVSSDGVISLEFKANKAI